MSIATNLTTTLLGRTVRVWGSRTTTHNRDGTVTLEDPLLIGWGTICGVLCDTRGVELLVEVDKKILQCAVRDVTLESLRRDDLLARDEGEKHE